MAEVFVFLFGAAFGGGCVFALGRWLVRVQPAWALRLKLVPGAHSTLARSSATADRARVYGLLQYGCNSP